MHETEELTEVRMGPSSVLGMLHQDLTIVSLFQKFSPRLGHWRAPFHEYYVHLPHEQDAAKSNQEELSPVIDHCMYVIYLKNANNLGRHSGLNAARTPRTTTCQMSQIRSNSGKIICASAARYSHLSPHIYLC
ncbi:hypothetical protein GALMADRAFT_253896 [Galerina marginata CBS 339.88]|uniref:Uncharacterized protein n=1 Tax=Galerina marginata (strain CBS 339.88) TaxID=685588 RepID=A0A067SKT8_GALM3|nr:hypothetical protein GALMADRAFT_253896 [Galerina marginata CBS 339.88]